MTACEFRTALKTLKLRQSWLAERLGVSTTTVNRWCTGKAPVPGYACFVVALLAELATYRGHRQT